jgi:hypothetical protein
MSVISAQNKAIESLKGAISSFVKRGIKTRVVPLAIPTGWGKTRIAIQAILKAKYSGKSPPNIVIWPQKQSHISEEVWMRCRDWCSKKRKLCEADSEAKCENNEIPEIRRLDHSKPGPKEGRHEMGAPAHNKKFAGTFYYVNNRFRRGVIRHLQKSNGPIVFVIDEWHSKKILEEYQGLLSEDDADDAEAFWREKLLGKSSTRQLFVILISATPIGATDQMDDLSDDSAEDNFENNIVNSLEAFRELTRVGNQNRRYDLYRIYPEVIKREQKKLERVHSLHGYVCSTKKEDWIRDYVDLSKKAYRNHPQKPAPPSLLYALESLLTSGVPCKIVRKNFGSLRKYFVSGFSYPKLELQKISTLINLLQKYKNKKFVIFCHHIAVASTLNWILAKKRIPAYYLKGNVSGDEFGKFNEEGGAIKVLIVTDKHSQGVSLHKSNAWLIHFELSWNPIRIIQRYGRVWRIDSKKKALTHPAAFYIPHAFSAEEEMINRLKRRWDVLRRVSRSEAANFVNLAPISFDVALGIRCSPSIG